MSAAQPFCSGSGLLKAACTCDTCRRRRNENIRIADPARDELRSQLMKFKGLQPENRTYATVAKGSNRGSIQNIAAGKQREIFISLEFIPGKENADGLIEEFDPNPVQGSVGSSWSYDHVLNEGIRVLFNVDSPIAILDGYFLANFAKNIISADYDVSRMDCGIGKSKNHRKVFVVQKKTQQGHPITTRTEFATTNKLVTTLKRKMPSF